MQLNILNNETDMFSVRIQQIHHTAIFQHCPNNSHILIQLRINDLMAPRFLENHSILKSGYVVECMPLVKSILRDFTKY